MKQSETHSIEDDSHKSKDRQTFLWPATKKQDKSS